MKHTPGPWTMGEWVRSQGHVVYRTITGAGRYVSGISVYGSRKDGTKSGRRNVSEEECTANARLIAAAPELLNVCRLAEEVLCSKTRFDHEAGLLLGRIRQAISQATGE